MTIYISYVKRPEQDWLIFGQAIGNYLSKYPTAVQTSKKAQPHGDDQLVVETYEVQS